MIQKLKDPEHLDKALGHWESAQLKLNSLWGNLCVQSENVISSKTVDSSKTTTFVHLE